jgi:hypothetical protein
MELYLMALGHLLLGNSQERIMVLQTLDILGMFVDMYRKMRQEHRHQLIGKLRMEYLRHHGRDILWMENRYPQNKLTLEIQLLHHLLHQVNFHC